MISEDSIQKNAEIQDVEGWVSNFASWFTKDSGRTMDASDKKLLLEEIMYQLPRYGYDVGEDFAYYMGQFNDLGDSPVYGYSLKITNSSGEGEDTNWMKINEEQLAEIEAILTKQV
ncbi:MAG: hypothetical protein KAR20_20705, partial [Candidatus Heimdallarchaeota archaeon]|nr:hypothetical protein [Candidatus Heimdallarchaeota archaeon]